MVSLAIPTQLCFALLIMLAPRIGQCTPAKSLFCGLLIGSEVGINVKWISTMANKIADDILRLKKNLTSTTSSFTYDFSKLKQDHADLKHYCFFHPSQELPSMIWQIALTCKMPDLDIGLALKLSGLGRLSG